MKITWNTFIYKSKILSKHNDVILPSSLAKKKVLYKRISLVKHQVSLYEKKRKYI